MKENVRKSKLYENIKASVLEDLVNRFHISFEDAKLIYRLSSIETYIRMYPFEVGHYPIEMISNKIWSLVCQIKQKLEFIILNKALD
jgi:hypothetical protein